MCEWKFIVIITGISLRLESNGKFCGKILTQYDEKKVEITKKKIGKCSDNLLNMYFKGIFIQKQPHENSKFIFESQDKSIPPIGVI